jgi:hypothetical protein
MQVILPCQQAAVRAAATQRAPRRTLPIERLHPEVEHEMATLLSAEVNFQNRLE